MEGYEFITAVDDKRWGTVVGKQDDWVIVEHGTLRKHCYAVPVSATEVDEGSRQVRTTLSGDLIGESPTVEKDFDHDLVARHYGLADTEAAPPTEGYGDTVAGDPAAGAEFAEQRAGVDTAAEERARIRSGDTDRTDGLIDESPAMLGDRVKGLDDQQR